MTDYSRYEDQAKELDEISARIFVHTANLRRRGIHDKKFKEIADLAEAADNVTLAVDNWVELQSKGGLMKVIEWEDLQPTITVLAELHKQRAELIQLIYELSGISDLARGQTDPNETLGAQKLKQTFGSSRFQRREAEARRFAAEAFGIKGEIVAEHFPREQLAEMTGVMLPTQKEIDDAKAQLQRIQQAYQQAQAEAQQAAQTGQPAPAQLPPPDPEQLRSLTVIAQAPFSWERIAKVLRSDYRRCYAVEVETDQSNFVDEEADKTARIQFLGIFNQLMQQFGPMIQGNPANGEFFKKIIMFVLGAFHLGRAVEEEIEHIIDNAVQQASQQQGQQQPDAKAQVAQINLQIAQTKLQHEQVKMQGAMQASGADAQQKVQEQQFKVQEAQLNAQEAQAKVQTQTMANEAKRQGHLVDLQNKSENLAFERATRADAREALLHGPTQAPAPLQSSSSAA
jgi:hypothetical protein